MPPTPGDGDHTPPDTLGSVRVGYDRTGYPGIAPDRTGSLPVDRNGCKEFTIDFLHFRVYTKNKKCLLDSRKGYVMKDYTIVFKSSDGEMLQMISLLRRDTFKDVLKKLPTAFIDAVDGLHREVYSYVYVNPPYVDSIDIAKDMNLYTPVLIAKGTDRQSDSGYDDWMIMLDIDLFINNIWSEFKHIVIAS